MNIDSFTKNDSRTPTAAVEVHTSPSEHTSSITDQFLNKLTHAVGHDLRSPMFVIRSYAQLLQRNQDKERLDRGLNMIGDATMKMEKIIDGLVGLVDIYTKPVPEYESLDLKQVLEAVQVQLYNEIYKHKPKFIVNFEAANTIHFPSAYLKEILFNLIDNAIRHNADHEDLIIKINTIKDGDKTILNVIDNGSQVITPKELKKIKEPLYSNCKAQSQAGMGLSRVEAIAQKVNGKLIIDNALGYEMMICKFVFP